MIGVNIAGKKKKRLSLLLFTYSVSYKLGKSRCGAALDLPHKEWCHLTLPCVCCQCPNTLMLVCLYWNSLLLFLHYTHGLWCTVYIEDRKPVTFKDFCNWPKIAIFVTAIVTMCSVWTTCRIALFDGQHKEDITIVLDHVLRIYLWKCYSVFWQLRKGGKSLKFSISMFCMLNW